MSQSNVDVRRRNSEPARVHLQRRRSSQQWTLQRLSRNFGQHHHHHHYYRHHHRQMKTNPYVGWFRHSPDTTMAAASAASLSTLMVAAATEAACKEHSNSDKTFLESSSSSLRTTKMRAIIEGQPAPRIPKGEEDSSSPSPCHCGEDNSHPNKGTVVNFPWYPLAATADAWCRELFQALQDEIYELLRVFFPTLKGRTTANSISELADFWAGRVRGGASSSSNNSNNRRSARLSSHADALTRIVGWILSPLLGDIKKHRSTVHLMMTPHAHPRPESQSSAFASDSEEDSHPGDEDEEEEEEDSDPDLEQPPYLSTPSRPSYAGMVEAPPAPVMQDEEVISNRAAEARYARQVARELNPDDAIPSRLDFVITQMDILRMQRNASRHLDVRSIYQLPTVTYNRRKRQDQKSHHNRKNTNSHHQQKQNKEQKNKTSTTSLPSEDSPISAEGWSWMIVTEQDQSMVDTHKSENDFDERCNEDGIDMSQEEGDDDSDDVCVICLEQFTYGDRLRVLPCGHSFHMGCIDRWLSGSASFDDCDTAGCPMCKKRPEATDDPPEEECDDELRPDGSVPSWAFSQLGSALLERDSQQLYTNSNVV